MAITKSLDESKIIAALITDVYSKYLGVNARSTRLTLRRVSYRVNREGLGFLTKTLPKMGKAFDRALSGGNPFVASLFRINAKEGSKLPKLFGELYERIFTSEGCVLQHPDAECVRDVRQLLYCFYKYKLPYVADQEQEVIDQFVKTEDEIQHYDDLFTKISEEVHTYPAGWGHIQPRLQRNVLKKARRLLFRVFKHFSVEDILPRHGPGAVSTRERLWDKYLWRNVSPRIAETYPIDEYFYSSLGHVCDSAQEIQSLGDRESPARVLLVPKDSRGPRLISCEPVDFQWVQQGLGRAIVEHVERHPLTRESVRFSDQEPSRNVALLASRDGKYATLDLKEASDRVTTGLVHLLFPGHVCKALMNCRSLHTELPSGELLKLRKFAPMGSALCFPVMALTIWAVLAAAAPDAHSRDRVYVYGDDVIVTAQYAPYAIEQLKAVGLAINPDKCCTSGLFRESCGMDAYSGLDVTPVRFRTVWSSAPRPDVYASYVAYCNELYRRRYFTTYERIVRALLDIYREVPESEHPERERYPALREVPESHRPSRKRTNKDLQKSEQYVWCVVSRPITKELPGWSMLLRFFAESANKRNHSWTLHAGRCPVEERFCEEAPFSVREYTKRGTSKLVKRWR
jgi:hypothetical protein